MRTRVALTMSWIVLFSAVGCAVSDRNTANPDRWERMRAEAALQLAEDHIAAGRFDRARSLLAAFANDGNPRVRLTLVRIDLEEGKYSAAVERLDWMTDGDVGSAPYYQLKAVACEGLGRWDDAASAYEAAYKLRATVPRLIGWVDSLVLARRAETAREVLHRERQRFPGEPALYTAAARLNRHMDEPSAALNELRLAALDQSGAPDARPQLARAYMDADDYEPAIAIWRELIGGPAGTEERLKYRVQLGRCLLEKGRMIEAHEVYRTITLTHPKDVRGHVGLATASLADGQVDAAIQSAEEALQLDPNDVDARLILALSHSKLGRTVRAMEVLSHPPLGLESDPLIPMLIESWAIKDAPEQ